MPCENPLSSSRDCRPAECGDDCAAGGSSLGSESESKSLGTRGNWFVSAVACGSVSAAAVSAAAGSAAAAVCEAAGDVGVYSPSIGATACDVSGVTRAEAGGAAVEVS